MEKGNKPVKLHFEKYVPNNCNVDLPPIIFVHGICDSSKTWDTIMPNIADATKRKAYAIDLRNHGKSEWDDSLSNDSVCLDIEHFLDKNGIDKCIFVAHSFGSRVCMNICLKKPELVEKIVIEEATLVRILYKELMMLSTLFSFVEAVNLSCKRMNEKDLRLFISEQAKKMYPGNYDVVNAVNCMPVCIKADGTFSLLFNIQALERSTKDKSLVTIDFTNLQVYNGPALVIYGEKSAMEVTKDASILQYFPNAKFYEFKEAGHYVHKEFRKEFETKVSEFLNS